MREDDFFRQFFAQHRRGDSGKCLVVAELSASHGQCLERALELIEVAHQVGADAVKIQTYRADTITIDSDREEFIRRGTIWDGQRLYELYDQAHTPWEWHRELFEHAARVGIPIFSTPFDFSAVTLLEELQAGAYKIGSFELVDIPLIEKVAATGKPLILSTGMATLAEIEEAVDAARRKGAKEIALLKANSAYPSPVSQMHLRTIAHLRETFDVVVGLSDHTIGEVVAVAAVALGAQMVEKHLCLSRKIDTPDSAFAAEPEEFARMVEGIRSVEEALGSVHYGPTPAQMASLENRRSLFVVEDVEAGEELTPQNVRSIRPGYGLHPRYYRDVLGVRVSQRVERGTPLSWDLLWRR